MPLLFLAFILGDLLSIAYPFFGYFLWREWHKYHNTVHNDYANRCMYGALTILVLIVLGKFFIKRLLSKSRKNEDEPHMFTSNKTDVLKRPDGSIINIEYYGNIGKPIIIFIHGWNANIRNWYYQRKYFEANYYLIMIDLPGLGKSKRPGNKDFSLSKLAADLNAVISYTGALNPILWGHSMGGMTILTLMTRYKHELTTPIRGIILEHTTYTNPLKTIIFSKLMMALEKPVLTPLCYILIALSPIVWLNRWMSYINGNSHIMTRLLTFAGTQTPKQLDFSALLSTMAPPSVMARGVLAMFKYDVTNELPSVTVPALILAANNDRLTKPEASLYMKDHIPNARLVTVAPGNHQSLIERHREVNDAAEQFISSLT